MSFQRYAEYKASRAEWLREVPIHWDVAPLKYTARLLTEKTTQQKFQVAMENIESWSGRFLETNGKYEGDGVAFKCGDILFGKLRPYLAKVWLAERNGEAIGDFHVLRPKIGVNSRFIQYVILNDGFISIVNGSTYGAKMPRVSWDFMGLMQVPVPPIPEQLAIITFLDRETRQIDALVAEQEKLITLLKEKRQVVISDAITKGLDPTALMKNSGIGWLGEVPGHWKICALKRFWSVTDCKHLTAEFVDEGIPLASIREVQSRFVELEEAKQTTNFYYELLIEGGRKPIPGDLILSRNATVGEIAQVATWHPPFAMGQDVCILRKKTHDLSSDYLQAVIHSRVVVEQLENLMVGSTFKRVNVEDIRNLLIPMPPSEEQAVIATFLEIEAEKIDLLMDQALCAVNLLKERRTALISAAITGKIDVRGLVEEVTA